MTTTFLVCLILLAIALTVVFLIRAHRQEAMSPREVLDQRLARGDLDAAEYTTLLANLPSPRDADDQATTPWR